MERCSFEETHMTGPVTVGELENKPRRANARQGSLNPTTKSLRKWETRMTRR